MARNEDTINEYHSDGSLRSQKPKEKPGSAHAAAVDDTMKKTDLAAAARTKGRRPGESDDAYAKRMADLRKPKPPTLVGNIDPNKAADAIEKNK